MEQLIKHAKEIIKKHPELEAEIQNLLFLCKDEIDAGESKDNEIQLCYSSINELVEVLGKKLESIKHWPESKNIDTTEYFEDTKVLKVIFNGGSIYLYKKVQTEIWGELLKTASIGQFINKAIKGTYEFERIK